MPRAIPTSGISLLEVVSSCFYPVNNIKCLFNGNFQCLFQIDLDAQMVVQINDRKIWNWII